MIEIYYRNLQEKKLKSPNEFKVGSWVNVENPTAEEIRRLADKLNLEQGLLHDALDPNEVPRMEVEHEITYIYTRVPDQADNMEISTVPLLIAVGDTFLLTLSAAHLPFLENFKNGSIDFYTTQKTKLFIQLFSAINSKYNRFLTQISRKVRAAKVRLKKIKQKDIIQFVNFGEVLNDFLSSLVPTNTTLQKLLSGAYLKLYEEDKELVEDLFLSNGQLIERCKSILKNIESIRDTYSTLMTHDLNRIIKLLTALTIILTVPTIVASIYGMNVQLPLQELPYAFWIIIVGTTVVALAVLFIFIRNRWL